MGLQIIAAVHALSRLKHFIGFSEASFLLGCPLVCVLQCIIGAEQHRSRENVVLVCLE